MHCAESVVLRCGKLLLGGRQLRGIHSEATNENEKPNRAPEDYPSEVAASRANIYSVSELRSIGIFSLFKMKERYGIGSS